MFRCFFKCAEKCSHGFWYCCDHLGLQWVPPWQAPWFPRHSQDWIIVCLGRPSPGNFPKTPLGWKIKHCAGKSSNPKTPVGWKFKHCAGKSSNFVFFSHITVWGSCFSLCTRRFRVRPPCRITTHHNITYHITTSLVTSQHRSSHLTHHTTTHHSSSQHHLSHLTHHSTSSHSCTVTAHSSQHNSSSHSCTAQLITQLWQHNSSSHSCTAHTAALHNSSHHLWQHNSSSHSWLSCGRRSTQSLLQELLRAWPPLGRGWLSLTPFQRRSLPPLRKKTPPTIKYPSPPSSFWAGEGIGPQGSSKTPPFEDPPHPYPIDAVCTLHSTLHPLHFTLYTLHATLDTLHFTLRTSHLHSILHSPQSPLHTLHTTFPGQRSTVYTLLFTLHPLHSTPFHTPQSTLVREECTRLLKYVVSQ